MTITRITAIEFYQNLGKLFYAIASADKVVKQQEFDMLKDQVKQKWMDVYELKNGSPNNAVLQIISVFDWLHEDGEYDAQTCYNEFVIFKNKHTSLFSAKVKQLILETASAIASSFSSKNKSELIMLARLHLELKK